MAGMNNQGGGEAREALERVMDNIREFILTEKMCPFCKSFPHADGHISHDEDCAVPYVEEVLK